MTPFGKKKGRVGRSCRLGLEFGYVREMPKLRRRLTMKIKQTQGVGWCGRIVGQWWEPKGEPKAV